MDENHNFSTVGRGSEDGPQAVFYQNASEVEKKIVDQVNKNRHAEQRLDALGFAMDGADGARSTFCLEWIINNVLSQGQRDDMTLAWAEQYGEILTNLEGKAREHIVAQERAQQRAKLAVPSTPSLVVPGNVRRTRRV